MLYLDSGECFAQGVRGFSRTFTTQQSGLDRIVLFVQVENVPTEAAIDTGGAYLFCNPQLADALALDPAEGVEVPPLEIRGQSLPGTLHRVFLNLIADEGESLQLDVTAFIPRPRPTVEIELPVYLGFRFCLEKCRFAIDPTAGLFYFGQ